MAQILKSVFYTGSRQYLVWSGGSNSVVQAWLWGAGGGGGGGDGGLYGGNATGGGFAYRLFTINPGDTLEAWVGGPGAGGLSNTKGPVPSPSGGLLFNTRTATPLNYTDPYGNFYPAMPTFARTSGSWGSFLNTYGVWLADPSAYQFTNVYQINVSVTGTYTITQSSSAYSSIYSSTFLPGGWFYQGGPMSAVQLDVTLTAGTHYMYLTAVGLGNGGVGVTISGGAGSPVGAAGGSYYRAGVSYSGGAGGGAGFGGWSGSGGGGGGATVIALNGTILGIAGGGAGGGGAGVRGGSGNAPNGYGFTLDTGGQSGQSGGSQPGDGGGGGGGGGGQIGGTGGYWGGGSPSNPSNFADVAGQGGYFGSSFGNSISNPASIFPAESSNPKYYSGLGIGGQGTASGYGQNGTPGYAAFEFQSTGVNVNTGMGYKPSKNIWIKESNVWMPVNNLWVKDSGVWKSAIGSSANFNITGGDFGVSSQSAPQYQDPNPYPYMSMVDIF